MNSLQATTRNTTTKGQVDQLRKNGEVSPKNLGEARHWGPVKGPVQ